MIPPPKNFQFLAYLAEKLLPRDQIVSLGCGTVVQDNHRESQLEEDVLELTAECKAYEDEEPTVFASCPLGLKRSPLICQLLSDCSIKTHSH